MVNIEGSKQHNAWKQDRCLGSKQNVASQILIVIIIGPLFFIIVVSIADGHGCSVHLGCRTNRGPMIYL